MANIYINNADLVCVQSSSSSFPTTSAFAHSSSARQQSTMRTRHPPTDEVDRFHLVAEDDGQDDFDRGVSSVAFPSSPGAPTTAIYDDGVPHTNSYRTRPFPSKSSSSYSDTTRPSSANTGSSAGHLGTRSSQTSAAESYGWEKGAGQARQDVVYGDADEEYSPDTDEQAKQTNLASKRGSSDSQRAARTSQRPSSASSSKNRSTASRTNVASLFPSSDDVTSASSPPVASSSKFDTLPPSSLATRPSSRPLYQRHQRHHSANDIVSGVAHFRDSKGGTGGVGTGFGEAPQRERMRTLSNSLKEYAASWIPASAKSGRASVLVGAAGNVLIGYWNGSAAGSEPATSPSQANLNRVEPEDIGDPEPESDVDSAWFFASSAKEQRQERAIALQSGRTLRRPASTSAFRPSYQNMDSAEVAYMQGVASNAEASAGSVMPIGGSRPSSALRRRSNVNAPPPQLDRRRLDKAVSLAVEAAQAAEEDAKRRKERQRERTRSGATAKSSASRGKKRVPVQTDGLGLFIEPGQNQEALALMPGSARRQRRSSDTRALLSSEADGRDLMVTQASQAAQLAAANEGARSKLGRFLSLPRGASLRHPFGLIGAGQAEEYTDQSDEYTESEEEEDEDARLDSDFSLDLYISSLTYMLSALSKKEALGVSEKHRQEMTARLTEALEKIGAARPGDTSDGAPARTIQGEEVKQLREQLAVLQHQHQLHLDQSRGSTGASTPIIHHHYHSIAPDALNTLQQAQASSTRLQAEREAATRSRKSSIIGTIASVAFDAGLAVTAGAISVAARGVASLVPTPLRSPAPASAATSPRGSPALGPSPDVKTASQTAQEQSELSKQELEDKAAASAQWNLALSLAGSAAQALSATLAISVGKEPRSKGGAAVVKRGSGNDSEPNSDAGALVPRAPLSLRKTASSIEVGRQRKQDGWGVVPATGISSPSADEIEQNLILAVSNVARAIKRSPLPAQLSILLNQALQLLQALDERYRVRQRAADIALKQAGMAARFIRQHHLHVILIRAAVASFEAAIAAVEAYRDESGWAQITAGNKSPVPAIEQK